MPSYFPMAHCGAKLDMTEEDVTKRIMKWLIERQWTIVSYDFPQSGTGRVLHPDVGNDKNFMTIVPDIIAWKSGTVAVFENKDRFVKSDFVKIDVMRTTRRYDRALADLLRDFSVSSVEYGIGIPDTPKNRSKSMLNARLVDFVAWVSETGGVTLRPCRI